MEKNYANVSRLAKEMFKINWYSGRITRNRNLLTVWTKKLIPRVIIKIHPQNDIIYVMSREHEEKARDFARNYENRFLQEREHTALRTIYD